MVLFVAGKYIFGFFNVKTSPKNEKETNPPLFFSHFNQKIPKISLNKHYRLDCTTMWHILKIDSFFH
jgi:hypothetical protein